MNKNMTGVSIDYRELTLEEAGKQNRMIDLDKAKQFNSSLQAMMFKEKRIAHNIRAGQICLKVDIL